MTPEVTGIGIIVFPYVGILVGLKPVPLEVSVYTVESFFKVYKGNVGNCGALV